MSNYKHRKSNIKCPEYRAWLDIKQRCTNVKSSNYKRYGGRGIEICDEWKDSFEQFIIDVGNRPSINHSIERIDNNGNYEASNCKWETKDVQSRNRRTNIFITYKTDTLCIKDMANKYGLSEMLLWQRLQRLKWSVEKSIETKIAIKNG